MGSVSTTHSTAPQEPGSPNSLHMAKGSQASICIPITASHPTDLQEHSEGPQQGQQEALGPGGFHQARQKANQDHGNEEVVELRMEGEEGRGGEGTRKQAHTMQHNTAHKEIKQGEHNASQTTRQSKKLGRLIFPCQKA